MSSPATQSPMSGQPDQVNASVDARTHEGPCLEHVSAIYPPRPRLSTRSSSASFDHPDASIESLPEEILSQIFGLALCSSREPASPFQQPTLAPRTAAALLAVSSSFRAIAIPLVYRSITIARPKQWSAFFGVGRGVFVAGRDIVQKRKALKQICLAEEADFPDEDLASRLASFRLGPDYPGGSHRPTDPLDVFGLKVDCLTMLCLSPLPYGFGGPRWRHTAMDTFQDGSILHFLRVVGPPTIRLAPGYTSRLVSHGREAHSNAVRIVTYEPTRQERAFRRHGRKPEAVIDVDLPRTFPGATIVSFEEEEATLKEERGQLVIV